MANSSNVLIYATLFCPYCMRARSFLNRKGIDFKEIDVSGNMDLWNEMETVSGRSTVPQIFIGDHHVGGYDDMIKLEHEGKLDAILANATS